MLREAGNLAWSGAAGWLPDDEVDGALLHVASKAAHFFLVSLEKAEGVQAQIKFLTMPLYRVNFKSCNLWPFLVRSTRTAPRMVAMMLLALDATAFPYIRLNACRGIWPADISCLGNSMVALLSLWTVAVLSTYRLDVLWVGGSWLR